MALPSGLSELKFDWSATGPLVEIGKKDAQTAIDLGEGVQYQLF